VSSNKGGSSVHNQAVFPNQAVSGASRLCWQVGILMAMLVGTAVSANN
jgi:hypothetical protein